MFCVQVINAAAHNHTLQPCLLPGMYREFDGGVQPLSTLSCLSGNIRLLWTVVVESCGEVVAGVRFKVCRRRVKEEGSEEQIKRTEEHDNWRNNRFIEDEELIAGI